jgi:branched-chain amino acid transport system permease protein
MLYREAGQFKTTYAADQAIFPILQDKIIVWGFVVLLFLFPFIETTGDITAVWILLIVNAMAALGLNILTGYCGQVSLGTAGFMGCGAFAAYKLATGFPEMNIVVVVLISGFAAAAIGIVFGLPSLRIKGLYLAVATLAAQFFLTWSFIKVPWLYNYHSSGTITAPPRTLFGLQITGPLPGNMPVAALDAMKREVAIAQYTVCLVLLIVFAFIAKNLVRGRLGRSWMAIRDMDIAAELIGIRPLRTKLLAFAISSYICGVAGAMLFLFYLGSVEGGEAFSIGDSFLYLFMVIIGGLGSIAGSFMGAAFITLLPIMLIRIPAWLGLPIGVDIVTNLQFMILGALILIFLIAEPNGLARLWQIAKEKLRLWPFPH